MSSDDFPLYLSSVKVIENDKVELHLEYRGEVGDIENAYLIGTKNNLSSDISNASVLSKGRVLFKIAFPIWEDGTFQIVIEKGGSYIYEPGEAHNIVFRGRGVFLDLRKIFHLSKDAPVPSVAEAVVSEEIQEVTEVVGLDATERDLEPAYDEENMLSLQPKDFRIFGPEMKSNLLSLLEYFENEKSKNLVFDEAILPDIARNLKQCISAEGRASVFDICFPIIIFIEKALIFAGMIHKPMLTEEKSEKYQKEVIDKIEEVRSLIKVTEFRSSTDLIKKEYDDDVHELKMRLREEI
ncbi:MAG: hypothetical protein ACXABK_00710 [Candidatus Heimdallarchaeaceae archaeon]